MDSDKGQNGVTRFRKLTRRRKTGVAAALLAAIVTSGYVMVNALAAPAFPAPVTVTFPANGGVYNAAAWSAGCHPTGICGSAVYLSELRGVDVGIYQQSSHRYWDGSSFSSSLPVFNAAIGTTTWNYAFTPPQDGDYTVFARAFYTLGHSNTLAIANFSYENVPPPAPLITSGPTNPSTDTSPEFIFTDTAWPDVTFSCSLDSGAAQPCTGDTDHDGNSDVEGELQLTGLAVGPHCFSVFATDEAQVGPTTTFCWTISASSGSFTVGGNLGSLLYPGIGRQLDLTFTNPHSSPITIAAGAITRGNITITSDTPGCAASNFEVEHGLKLAVTIPANRFSPVSLATLGVPRPDWPVIKMIDTHTNQDACEGARLTLTYSRIGAS